MMRVVEWAMVAGLAGVAFMSGYWTANHQRSNAGPDLVNLNQRIDELIRLQTRPIAPIQCAAVVDSREVAAELTRSLSQQRGCTAAAASAATNGAPAADVSDSETTPEMIRAFDSGRDLINRARRAGHWSDPQVEELRGLLNTMSEARAAEVTAELLKAINSGELRADVTGAPF